MGKSGKNRGKWGKYGGPKWESGGCSPVGGALPPPWGAEEEEEEEEEEGQPQPHTHPHPQPHTADVGLTAIAGREESRKFGAAVGGNLWGEGGKCGVKGCSGPIDPSLGGDWGWGLARDPQGGRELGSKAWGVNGWDLGSMDEIWGQGVGFGVMVWDLGSTTGILG